MVPDSEYVLNKYLLNTLINQLIFHKHITYQTNCAWFGCTVTEERSYVSAVVTWWQGAWWAYALSEDNNKLWIRGQGSIETYKTPTKTSLTPQKGGKTMPKEKTAT